jgi:hypothetical protein
MCQNMERVIGRYGKVCGITKKSMGGDNKLHSNWMQIFGFKLGPHVGSYALNSNYIYKVGVREFCWKIQLIDL